MIEWWHLACDLEEWCKDKKEGEQVQNLVGRQYTPVCRGEEAFEWESMETDWDG